MRSSVARLNGPPFDLTPHQSMPSHSALSLAASALVFLGCTSESQEGSSDAGASTSKPRLVVLLSVDQMIPDQLERLGPHFTGGFRRLLDDGAVFTNAALDYARTETGAGHATLATGCLPRSHGIVGNGYWDRASGKERYCVQCDDAVLVTSTGILEEEGHRSPESLLRPTLGELIQRGDPEARVVSISAKDRSAITMCGRSEGGVALWWSKKAGGFATSTGFAKALPEFARDWNESAGQKIREFVWDDTIPDAARKGTRTAPDERDGERPRGKSGVTFPYAAPEDIKDENLATYAYATPLVDRFVAELASRAMEAHELGQDDHTDVLALSFSACDVVGHGNGPYSREVTDVLFRLDRELGRLFEQFDAATGEAGWVAALTADHGVLPLPEWLQKTGVDARRIPKEERGRFRIAVRARLEERFGGRLDEHSAPAGYYIDPKTMAEVGVDPVVARKAMAEEMRELRPEFPWIADAYSVEEIAAFGDDQMGVRHYLWNSFHPARTADVVVVQEANVLVNMLKGTSHGSHYAYDRGVPLVFLGPGVSAGKRGEVAGSHDIVPTVLELIGVSVDAEFDGSNRFAEGD